MKSIKIILLIPFLLFIMAGCSQKIGYGVVLWSDDESVLANGVLVEVIEMSTIENTYTVALPGSKDRTSIESWRLQFFEDENEAAAYRTQYEPFVFSYAECEKLGLPVRDQPDTTGKRVYKLEDRQKVKILRVMEEEVEIGQFAGHWVELLTEDGVTGYTFDYYLRNFEMQNGEAVYEQRDEGVDESLKTMLATVWRPDFYEENITMGWINLDLFRADYKLVFDEENKTISYSAPWRRFTRDYESIVKIKANEYEFVGASFRVIFYRDDFISVQYAVDNRDYSEAWVYFDQPLSEVISEELNRREIVYQSFVNDIPVLENRLFGNLTFTGGRKFQWSNKSRLIAKKVVTASAGSGGTVSFKYFLSQDLWGRYDGVLAFVFDGGDEAVFLYKKTEDGLTLSLVDKNEIDNSVVLTDFIVNPVVIEFKTVGGGSQEEN